jgi:hypothetical protein
VLRLRHGHKDPGPWVPVDEKAMQQQRRHQTDKKETISWPGTRYGEEFHWIFESKSALRFLPHPGKAASPGSVIGAVRSVSDA